MSNIKKIHIPGLYNIKKSDKEKMIHTLMSAFQKYPKLMNAFPHERERIFALEATIRYYSAYDLHYGSGFSLDEKIREVALLIHSDHMHYTLLKHLKSGSYDKDYRRVIRLLSRQERKTRIQLFKELDHLEHNVDIPAPHIYLDFLGTAKPQQHQGKGRRLMKNICAYADHVRLPIMLFTNTKDDVRFYQSLGFEIIGVTSSKQFGFTNTYLLYTPH